MSNYDASVWVCGVGRYSLSRLQVFLIHYSTVSQWQLICRASGRLHRLQEEKERDWDAKKYQLSLPYYKDVFWHKHQPDTTTLWLSVRYLKYEYWPTVFLMYKEDQSLP